MNQKSEYLLDLIFKNFKDYKAKKIFLEKKISKNLFFHFLKKTNSKRRYKEICYIKNSSIYLIMYNFSSLTIFLIITFMMSLYILYKVTSNVKN